MPHILTTLLIITFLASSVQAGNLNPTKYLLKGEIASFNGYLVEAERLQKSVQAVQELDYQKKLNELQEKYYEEKLENASLKAQLELKAANSKSEAVEKALKEKLAKKEVFYRQPWFVSGVTILLTFLLRSSIPIN